MSQDNQNEAEGILKTTTRRDVLKRTLVVLGAAALVQPAGGVAFGQETPKKEDSKNKSRKKKRKGKDKKGSGQGKPNPAPDTPKKDGGSK